MPNAETVTGLLKPGPALPVVGKAHREDQVVIGHHGFNRVGQDGDEMLEKRRGILGGAGGGDPDHRLAREVVDRRKFEFRAIFPAGEIFQVDMHESPGRVFS